MFYFYVLIINLIPLAPSVLQGNMPDKFEIVLSVEFYYLIFISLSGICHSLTDVWKHN